MTLRLFLALDPPEPVRRRLAGAQDALRRAAGRHADAVRWVAPDRLHLTVQFLGDVPEARLAAVRAVAAEAAAALRPLRLEVRGAGGFPTARRPRVLWAGVSGDVAPLQALAAQLGRGLAPLGFPGAGPVFTPHLTLGRSREPRGAARMGGAIAAMADGDPVPWRADELLLFRSHLAPGGPRYEVIGRWRLGGSGEPATGEDTGSDPG